MEVLYPKDIRAEMMKIIKGMDDEYAGECQGKTARSAYICIINDTKYEDYIRQIHNLRLLR